MPTGDTTLHGNAPDSAPVALLLIDVINDFEFEGGEALFTRALPAAHSIAALKQEAHALGIPTIYVNDNFGRWQSNFHELIEHCLHDGVCGEPIARLLLPDTDDYFILKPKHSGFYQTALDILLTHLEAKTLILTGFAGDFCVLFTANDAYMRSYKLIVPCDCVASESDAYNQQALDLMARVLKAHICNAQDLDLRQLLNDGNAQS
jgi:nicotinamidase-related amidase